MQFTLSELLIAAFIAWLLLAMLAGTGNHHKTSDQSQHAQVPGMTYQLPTAHVDPATPASAHQTDLQLEITRDKAEIEAMLDEADNLLR